MSVIVGLFSNYAYDIKYMDTSEPSYKDDKAYKLNRFNWMILVLTMGISVRDSNILKKVSGENLRPQ